jgi:RimJ/RimL family protein N-acetyltransferase
LQGEETVAEKPNDECRQDYTVSPISPVAMSEKERADCLAIIRSGGAVNPESSQREIPLAAVVVVARRGNEIIGVGAIKRVRRDYAAIVCGRSGEELNSNIPELGYVAIDPQHRGNHLSSRIVAELLSHHDGPLFATTDDMRMKATLARAGFVRKGHEWDGDRGRLSLWVRG